MCWCRREDQGITLVFFLLLRPLQFTKAAHTKFDFCPLAAPSSFIISLLTSQLPQLHQRSSSMSQLTSQLIRSLCSCLIVAHFAAHLPAYMPAPSWERVLSMSGPISERGLWEGKILGKNYNMELQYEITIWNFSIKLQYGIKICQYFWRKIKNGVGTCNVPTHSKRNKRAIAPLLL